MLSPPAGISIRPPTRPEKRACRMLLPHATGGVQDLRFYVAVDGAPARVVGAAAVGLDTQAREADGWRVDVHVIPTHRRRGIARALVEHAAADARAHRIPALYSWDWPEADSEALAAWRALGFEPIHTKYEFGGTLADFLTSIGRLYDQLRSRGRIPDDARLVTLPEVDPRAVAALHMRHLGGRLEQLLPMIAGAGGGDDAFDPRFSMAVLVGERLVALALGRTNEATRTYTSDAVVVDPTLRGGWANVWPRYEICRRLLAAGYHELRFFAMEKHRDTRHAAARLGSRLIATRVQLRLALDDSRPPVAAGDARGRPA